MNEHNNNDCLWCNEKYQEEEAGRRKEEREEDKEAHRAILKRLNLLTGAIGLVIALLMGTGAINVEDLIRYKNLLADSCEAAIEYCIRSIV
jgi:hypothetical protein